ncbi:hypothetical protein AZE42_09724 [Rhizopogon vesiculosus]|uniref:Uncharacterized protein n=1 Tax=Rhizopogon vesiculosus TaxID=180088 RepID=A0A1J8PYQ2_9AGAM|nr:hypothetical protein AZE42_09724 [Rhizopogon vesiculosus]
MSPGDEMNALRTTTRPKPRRKQRTLPADDENDHSDHIELIAAKRTPNKARPQRKEGKVKASQSRPNGKVPDSQSNTKPESQVKGKAPESRAKDNQVKPKPVKVVAKKYSLNLSIDDALNYDDDGD